VVKLGGVIQFHSWTEIARGVSFLVSLSFVSFSPAYSSNGIELIGVGPVQIGNGGAGVARPQTSQAIYINPAGMNQVGNRGDLTLTVGFSHSRMGTSLARGGNPSAIDVHGTENPVLIPNGSAVFSLLKNNRLSLGIGAVFTAGFQVDYPVSRLPSALTQNQYDRSGRYANLKILPAVSFRIFNQLSLGAALDINYAMLESDSAVTAPGFPETTGQNRDDSALGIGGRIGLIYTPHPRIQIGALYVTPQRYQRFDRYADLIPGSLNLPQEVVFGLAVTPFSGALLQTDFKWINWSSGFLGSPVAAGGLQWRDQYVFAGGFQYDFHPHFQVPLTLRLGYNYGRSPVSPAVAFPNVLIPGVVEHHLTTGISYEITKHVGIDAAYVRDFKNTVVDNGSLNPLGGGGFVGNSGHAFSLGIHGTWGRTREKP